MVESSKIASGSPALLIGVYFNSVISFASLMGYIPASNHVPILVVSILAGFLVFLGGFIELIRGDILGGTLNLVFGLFFIMLSGVVNLLVFQGSLFNVPVESGTATGWIFLALGITLVILTPINFFLSGIVSMLLLCADVGVLIIAFVSLGVLSPSLMPLAAWLILILGLIAMYISAGTLYNTVLGKAIFPMGGPFIKSNPDSKK
jgi:succinate-acetate transporter protein